FQDEAAFEALLPWSEALPEGIRVRKCKYEGPARWTAGRIRECNGQGVVRLTLTREVCSRK
ncbi:hypothetical protein, partial [Alicyclobacillus hesperidum]|uniref:hypothetical protein n=1 Tax=Alicyclobacillus hesperidum TaxID=89784 RepID=UPI0024E1206E